MPIERARVDVSPDVGTQAIEEIYTCDENGIVQVTIQNQTAGYEKTFRLME